LTFLGRAQRPMDLRDRRYPLKMRGNSPGADLQVCAAARKRGTLDKIAANWTVFGIPFS